MVVMFALVAVGVGTAAVFTRSACERLAPDAVPAGVAGSDVDAVLTEMVDDAEARATLTRSFGDIADLLGPVTGVADVTGAQRLAVGADGVAALGSTTTVLGPDGASVRSRADLDDGRPVGSGATLYSLAVANELTGQVDALLPLDGDLEGLTCVDTALINTPLAFQLAAGDGELLLFRVDEDGAEPELELRDPVAGSVWSTPVEVGVAQPGILGQRLTAAMSDDLAVMGRRTAPGDDPPAMTAADRDTGSVAWTIDRQDLGALPDPELPTRTDVVAAGEGLVVVALTAEPADGEVASDAADTTDGSDVGGDEPVRLGVFDAADGAARWQLELDAGDVVRDVVVADGRVWAAIASVDDTISVVEFDPDGEVVASASVAGGTGGVAALPDGGAFAVLDRGVVLADATDGGASAITWDVVGRDVVAHDGGVTALFETPDDGAVAVTFGR
jgi:hypothetical protein